MNERNALEQLLERVKRDLVILNAKIEAYERIQSLLESYIFAIDEEKRRQESEEQQ